MSGSYCLYSVTLTVCDPTLSNQLTYIFQLFLDSCGIMLKPSLVSWSFYILLSDLISPPTHDSHTEALWLPDNENMFAAQICVNAILYLLSADVKVRAKNLREQMENFQWREKRNVWPVHHFSCFLKKYIYIYIYCWCVSLFFPTKSDVE